MGDRVECDAGRGGWSPGTVVALLYRDDYMPPGLVAPYQIKLDSEEDDNDYIWAPRDCDSVIRAEGSGEADDDEEMGEDDAEHVDHSAWQHDHH